MKFFLDSTFGPRLARALQVLDPDVDTDIKHLSELFPSDTLDVVWLPQIAQDNRVLVTGDLRILHNKREGELLRSLDLIALFMPRKYAARPLWDQVTILFRAWPEIKRAAAGASRRDCFHVKENGRIEMIPRRR